MDYLDSTIHESLRLSCPAILSNGVFLPKNSLISFNGFLYSRSKKKYGLLANEFNPERSHTSKSKPSVKEPISPVWGFKP
ncbi:hypothetical protein AYI69_g8778, partial [Smittium culicis]